MSSKRAGYWLAGAICLGSQALWGQIDTIPQRAEAAGFSGVILIHDQSGIRLHEAFGDADREHHLPNRPDTRFPIASITKLFTAVLLLQLRQQGHIELSQPVSTYVPEYGINAFDAISVHQLLNHTSGLPVTEEQAGGQHGVAEIYTVPLNPDQAIKTYLSGAPRQQQDPQFEYNNGDYIVLGKIIETVTQQPFQEVLHQRILAPLGLNDTGLIASPEDLTGLAKGYRWQEDTRSLSPNPPMRMENYFAAGAMYSTAGDLLTFYRALFSGKLLQAESMSLLLRTHPQSRSYGYGVWVRYPQYNRTVPKVVQRFGRIWGFSHLASYFLDHGITVIVLANTDRINPVAIEEVVGTSLLD